MTTRAAVSTGPAGYAEPTNAAVLAESARSRRWTALLERMAAGDLDACGTFYDESAQLTFSLIMQIVHDRNVAEDALVDLYVDVRDRARRGEHRNRNPLAWLITLARSTGQARRRPRRSAPGASRSRVLAFVLR